MNNHSHQEKWKQKQPKQPMTVIFHNAFGIYFSLFSAIINVLIFKVLENSVTIAPNRKFLSFE